MRPGTAAASIAARQRLPPERVPPFVPSSLDRWWFCLGSTPLCLLLVLAVTGVTLALHYAPDPDRAWASVLRIEQEMRFGWLVRGLHRTGADLLALTALLHLARTYFCATYGPPRRLTWVTGCPLLGAVLALGYTGRCLVWDQQAAWAAAAGGGLLRRLPVVGSPLALLVFGEPEVGGGTLARLFVLHALLLPAGLLVLVLLHLERVRRLGVQGLEGGDAAPVPLWPGHALVGLAAGLLALGAAAFLCLLPAPQLGPPAGAWAPQFAPRPSWYLAPLFLLLQHLPAGMVLALLGAGGAVLAGWPWLEGWLGACRLPQRVQMAVGLAAVGGLVALVLWE
ncbi:MAG: cytochrome b N-terminal domain-containing protein [Candidatus Latescibacterota bacterium]